MTAPTPSPRRGAGVMADTEDTETLADAEMEALAVGIHEARLCNCDSGDGDRMVADRLAPTVERIVAARLLARDERIRADEREKLAAERGTTHTWGFYDTGGHPYITGVAHSDAGPHAVYEHVVANITHCGSEVENQKTTRTLDGWFVGAEFDSSESDGAARMWHRIFRGDDEWAANWSAGEVETRG